MSKLHLRTKEYRFEPYSGQSYVHLSRVCVPCDVGESFLEDAKECRGKLPIDDDVILWYGAIYAMNTDGSNMRRLYAPRTFDGPNAVQQVTGGYPSPGSLFTVYGSNLGPDGIAVPTTLPAPTQLAGVSVFVNGHAVPILAVTPWQVNAHMPQDVPPGEATIQVEFADGGATPAGTVPVWLFYPGFFCYPEDYFPQAAAFHAGTAIPSRVCHREASGFTRSTSSFPQA